MPYKDINKRREAIRKSVAKLRAKKKGITWDKNVNPVIPKERNKEVNPQKGFTSKPKMVNPKTKVKASYKSYKSDERINQIYELLTKWELERKCEQYANRLDIEEWEEARALSYKLFEENIVEIINDVNDVKKILSEELTRLREENKQLWEKNQMLLLEQKRPEDSENFAARMKQIRTEQSILEQNGIGWEKAQEIINDISEIKQTLSELASEKQQTIQIITNTKKPSKKKTNNNTNRNFIALSPNSQKILWLGIEQLLAKGYKKGTREFRIHYKRLRRTLPEVKAHAQKYEQGRHQKKGYENNANRARDKNGRFI